MNMFAKYDNFMANKQIKNELFFMTAQAQVKTLSGTGKKLFEEVGNNVLVVA